MFNLTRKNPPSPQEVVHKSKSFLSTLSPLVANIYSNSALFAIGKGLNTLSEIIFYLIGLSVIAFAFIMSNVFPFHVLGDIISKREYETALISKSDIELFNIAVRGLVVFIGILFITIGMLIRKGGERKILLQQAGKELKNIETYFKEVVDTNSSLKQDSEEEINSDLKE